jgi:hypothetical protein
MTYIFEIVLHLGIIVIQRIDSTRTTHTFFRNTCTSILSLTLLGSPPAFAVVDPLRSDIETVQSAFRDFDLKRLNDADREFSISIDKWKSLERPRDEVVSLIKARANVRLDNKQFEKAIVDYDESLELMKSDGEKEDGTGRYPGLLCTTLKLT